jgi:toxin ParE1/3/4
LEALAYIHQDRPAAARRFLKKAEKSLKRLEKFPDSGRLVPEFPELPYRELVVTPYRFFYKREGNTVWIVGAWHSAQNVSQPAGDG